MTSIRALAKAATPGSWQYFKDWVSIQSANEADAAYIAFMIPERALAMQDCVDALQKCVDAIKALEGTPVEYGPGMKLGHASVAATAALARLEAIR